jgi:5-methylcytosine-specific restriction endonuclease McrA
MKHHRRLDRPEYQELHRRILQRDNWRCQFCGARTQLQVHHLRPRALLGADEKTNLITLCQTCHQAVHLHLPE